MSWSAFARLLRVYSEQQPTFLETSARVSCKQYLIRGHRPVDGDICSLGLY